MRITITIFFIALIFQSCFTYERFTLSTKTGDKPTIKMSGYYSNYELQKEGALDRRFRIFFYSNGAVYVASAGYDNETYQSDIEFEKQARRENDFSDMTRWGVYIIKEKEMTIQLRMSDHRASIINFHGSIINDSLIQLDRPKNNYLKFHPFNKPDSTNRWNNSKGFLFFGQQVF